VTAAPQTPPTVGAWPMFRAMVGVGALSGLFIVTVFEVTGPVIADNRAQALQEAVFEVLPAAAHRVSFDYVEGEGMTPAAEGERGDVEVAYDAEGALVGVAIEASGMGYADIVRVLYGFDPEAQAIVGFRVLESKETPGLGTRIATDPDFRANFERLDVSLDEGGAALAHPLEGVAPGTREEPWQIDTITGATISSVAVVDMLRESTAVWVPRVQGAMEALSAFEPPSAEAEGTEAEAEAEDAAEGGES
jgi:electron transport complex protein RnfG